MDQYFIDYEIYQEGIVARWGNASIETYAKNLNEIMENFRVEVADKNNVNTKDIRIRFFNKII